MKKYLLGIDLGTSACKVAVFAFDGTAAATASATYPVYYPRPGWAEQNPDEWWEAVCKAVKEVLRTGMIEADEIAGIGVDGQSWSAVAVDKEGRVLTNTPIWMDTRAQEICDELNEKIGEDRIFNHAGNALRPSYTTAKILWYKKYLPHIYEQTVSILQSNSFIVYRLTGEKTTDKSQGYGVHCFHMESGSWDKEMGDLLGISQRLLPPLAECSEVVGRVTEQAAALTGLTPGIPVVAGGLDAACGTLGAGLTAPGEAQEQGGQAGGMSICMDTYHANPRLILGYHVIPGMWLLQGGTTGGGGAMRWFSSVFAGEESLEELNEKAERIPEGSEGLLFLPYMAGERSPIWNPDAKGIFYGLDFAKNKGHFVRAVMEGVAYSLRHNLETAAASGVEAEELRAMGGSANSRLWTQIKADVTGKTIKVPASDTATTLGAAILAGVGVGVYESFEEAAARTIKIRRVHIPDQKKMKVYDRMYRKYLELYQNVKDMMKGQEENDG